MGVFSTVATAPHQKERELQREIARTVESALPGVEVLALELTGKERFCVYVDHPHGVDHALCERVSHVLRGYNDRYSIEVSSPAASGRCSCRTGPANRSTYRTTRSCGPI